MEVACAFARRRREGFLTVEDHATLLLAFDYDVAYWYNILDVTPEVVDTARMFADEHPLRAYDAIHLATAWLTHRELVQAGLPAPTFVCEDEHLLAIVEDVGISTENPNRHP